jgi:solute carrier family 25 carnitine/acylcarnitine transporter 20/29
MGEEPTAVRKSTFIPAITGEIDYKNPLFTMPQILQPYKVGILSYSASMVSTFCGYPLDSIKTRMQTHNYKNAFTCLKATIQNEGVRGLYRGIVVPLVTTSFSRSFTVSIYTSCKPIVGASVPDIAIDGLPMNVETQKFVQNFSVSFISATIAGAAISLFACPFELTKIFQQIVMVVNKDAKVQISSNELPKRVVDVAHSIVKYEGLRGLYSGYSYHLTRDAFAAGLFYSIYETVKMKLQSINQKSQYFSESSKRRIDALCVPLSGAVSGCIASGSVYPLDTIKAKYQRDVLGNIIRVKMGLEKLEIKPRKLIPSLDMYKGFGPSIIRSVGVTMIFFSAFEFLMGNIA